MKNTNLIRFCLLPPSILILAFFVVTFGSCSKANSLSSNSSAPSIAVVKPNPEIISIIASTNGVQDAYCVALDITIKNNGAEGTILVVANVAQAEKVEQSEMPVFIKSGQTQEIKMTFPLVWQGGDWTPSAKALVP